ncbi:hypothetical protein EST38_g4132 [Candolleomyces aberdarensis]|uniref:NAD(P)-binding domain-containing protein n=1 Tax=Candolleomyces aberdarensis TaxID=2316362 RepID=A0A4Q2DQN6_9AGAR|nr:hypothetical protein EST38_g4132 [Candolleomyces aberdarensis]
MKILFTGATGYIGGSVLAKLLENPRIPTFNITAIVRSEEKAEKLRSLNVNAVVGSLSDQAFLERLASESDIVISTADADNFDAAVATLRGLKKRYEVTSVPPIFIHTSGTGVLSDDARGMYPTETIYDDLNIKQIESLAPTQIHRNVDLALVDADTEGYIRSYIILPSTIYGIAENTLVDMGIQNAHSQQAPLLIKAALARGQGGMVGEVADIFILVLEAILSNKNPGHGREGFYFGENGEHTLYDIGKRISEVLVELGVGKNPEPTSFTKEEIDKYFSGSYYLGTNSRCRANRVRDLGWKPTKTTKDLLDSLDAEAKVFLKSHPVQ